MYALMIYSLKAGVCLAVFYLFFKLLLSRETFHRLNRIVVLGAMAASFILPLCVITLYREVPLPSQPLPATVVETAAAPGAAPAAAAFPWEEAAGWCYALGAAGMLLWIVRSLAGIVRVIRRGRRGRLGARWTLVVVPQAVTPFSWGRWVVISEEDLAHNGEAILCHEQAHLRLHHSADLLLTDLAGCLQWFNPAMWLLRRELRAIHEYEADAAVLRSGVDAREYQMLLIRKAAGRRWYSVANSFNHSKLKNRITMMLRKKSSRWAAARALLLLPLAAMALGAFAETRYVVVPAAKDTKNLIKKLELRTKSDTVVAPITIHLRGKEVQDPAEQPLILVDGKRVPTLDTIRTERIASVTVLKDSAALQTYGEEGRHGVILVEMKKDAGPDAETLQELAQSAATLGILFGKMGLVVAEGALEAARDRIPAEEYAKAIADIRAARARMQEELGRGEGFELPDTLDKGVTVIGLENLNKATGELQTFFRSDEWKEMQKKFTDSKTYFESDEWKQAQEMLKQLGEMELSGSASSLRLRDTLDTWIGAAAPSIPGCNTELGATGGAMVTGPDVMSKTRSTADGTVTVVKGRVTADFSQISEANYRIELDGQPATKADLELLAPGKIRRLELSTLTTPGRKGELRVHTRR
ncbi:MAG TPA: M56 family peptidase [Candidatus Alistipes faecavium]|nr:M56 family peptidase [Candidatus Alistipes faecavium]